MCAVRGQSAPGPDHISYLAWNSCGEGAAGILYECYLGIIVGGEVPTWLNCYTLVFFPKGDGEQHGVSVQAMPDGLRPLALSSTDQKPLALAVNETLSEICEKTVHDAQRGFRRGKTITDNVLELEAQMARNSILGAKGPSMLLMDIKAAFPSVALDWVWWVLGEMECPAWLVSAVRALYGGSTAQIAVGGMREVVIAISSGIEQGCPMSGSLWRLAFDPVIRFLIRRTGRETCKGKCKVIAFADGLCFATDDIIGTLKGAVPVLDIMKGAAGLALNWFKTFVSCGEFQQI